jgi:hypothetical protein
LKTAAKVSSPGSLEFWVWNGFPVDARPITAHLAGYENKDSGGVLGIGGTGGEAGKLFLQGSGEKESGGSVVVAWGKRKLAMRTWHHVVLQRGEKGEVKVYLDGELEIDMRASSSDSALLDEWTVGGGPGRVGLEGRLDEVAVYDRLLTAEEVGEHYRMGR